MPSRRTIGAALLREATRVGRAAVVLAVVTTAAVVGVAPAGAADGGARVTVRDGTNGSTTTQTLGTAEIAAVEDVFVTTYTVVTPRGTTRSSFTGTTAAAVAGLAGVTPRNVDQIEVTAPTAPGQRITFTGDQVRDGFLEDPAADGEPRFGLFQGRASGSGDIPVLRPYLPAGPGTEESSQELSPASGAPIDVTIATVDGVVGVALDASDERPDPGTSIGLSARTTNGSSDVRSVRWSFGDGGTSSDPSTSHAYERAGTYVARATVETEDGRSGVGSVRIVVGTPPPTPTTPDEAAQPGAAGPGGTVGGGSGDTRAPATGPSEPPAGGGTASPSSGSAGAGAAGPTRSTPRPAERPGARRPTRSSADAPTRSSAAPPAATAAPAAPATATPDGGPATRGGRERRRPRAGSSSGGDGSIRGVLVASRTAAVVPATPTLAVQLAARRGAEPRDPSDLAWIVGPLAVLLLLGAGASRELRPRRTRLPTTRMPT